MNDDYVKRSDVHKAFQPKYAPAINRTFAAMIDSVPAADVSPVRHGRWSLVEARRKESVYRCSECGSFFAIRADTLNGGRGDMSYCPSCGAKMDGGKNE